MVNEFPPSTNFSPALGDMVAAEDLRSEAIQDWLQVATRFETRLNMSGCAAVTYYNWNN